MKKIILLLSICFSFMATPANSAPLPMDQTNIFGQGAVEIASEYLGTRYCRGGESPRCFDCSGFTQYVYAKQGIYLDRRTNIQYKESKIIPKEEAKVGDLVFFLTKNGYAYHVGIYVGDNQILHAPKPGRSVKIETIWSSRVKFATVV